ncbi:MAG: hypothetical protein IJR47_04435, partial [Clostridia bacterium]|nr:hypothetical protein [Clostridia bacterium]
MAKVKGKLNGRGIAIIAIIVLLIIGAVVFLLMPKKAKGNEEPNSSIPGYYSSTQRFNGGNAKTNKNVNVSGVAIENNSGGAKIDISFHLGSKASGVDVADTSSVPEYSVYCYENPYRLVVKLSNITFWDYEDEYAGINAEGLAIDVFRPYTSTLNKGDAQDIYLFFQLRNDLAFKVDETNNGISIDLKSVAQPSTDSAYYVISSLYYDWEKMIDKVELNPTITKDFSMHVLISKPFASESEANQFMNSAAGELQKLNVSNALTVKQMTKGELPEYDDTLNNSVFINNTVISVNGKESLLPLLMPYGQYLCSTPDGKTMLFAKDISIEDGDETGVYVELWVTELSGKETKLNIGGNFEFSSIDKAAFSPDGKKLALLNNTSHYSLEVYDFDTNEIINLGEEGIGNMVANFAWDSHSNLMNVVAGDNNVFQMKTYDFTKPYGQRVNVLSETPLEKDVGFKYAGGQLYYTVQLINDNGYDGTVYRIGGSAGSTAQQVAKGIAFEISPDGKYMAVKDITDFSQFQGSEEEQEFGEGAKVYGLKLIDLATGTETRIAQNA